MKHLGPAILIFCGFLPVYEVANAAESAVPEPFQRFDDASKYTINYDDLTALLEAVVADLGRSSRMKAPPSQAKTGTRAQARVNRSTINEGNRFYFETFENDAANKQALSNIQKGIEQATTDFPLERFSRDEQLAYWLNLYNATVLNEIVKVYPQRDLEKLLQGKNSILSKPLLTVEGVSLSLNDIQFTILKNNYDNNPLILYGLYQGIIGGPNIRQRAYTGADVYRALKDNAIEFINSNRGTASKNAKSFRVSSFYERNAEFFPNFSTDLTAHLLKYLEGPEQTALQAATKIKPDINDWTVTDLGGTRRVLGGSFADSGAGLQGSISGSSPASVSSAMSGGSSSGSTGGINSALAKQVQENNGNTTEAVEDREDAPIEPDTDPVPEGD